MPIYFLAVTQPFYKTILCLRKDLVNGQNKTKQLSQSWKVVHFLFTYEKNKSILFGYFITMTHGSCRLIAKYSHSFLHVVLSSWILSSIIKDLLSQGMRLS